MIFKSKSKVILKFKNINHKKTQKFSEFFIFFKKSEKLTFINWSKIDFLFFFDYIDQT